MQRKPKRPTGKGIAERREHMRLLLSEHANTASETDYYHPNSIIRTESYALLYDYVSHNGLRLLLRDAAELGISPDASQPVDAASFALTIMTADNQDILSKVNRSKWSIQLRYAYEHDVKPWWLPPFLLQAGGYVKVLQKTKHGHRENWRHNRPKWPYPTSLNALLPDAGSSTRRSSLPKGSE
jgi:hypothetical protein